MFRNFKVLMIVLVLIVLAGGAYAFAAAVTFDGSGDTAGSGSQNVADYVVSSVVYDLNATDPSLVDNITFTIAPTDAVVVYIQPGTTNAWTTTECTNTTGSVACDLTGLSISLADIDALAVVASNTTNPAP